MPTEINAKVDLLKVCKDIVEHLGEVLHDVNSYVIPARGQSSLAESARTALQAMVYAVASLEAMSDSDFAMVPEPAKAAVKEEHPSAKGNPAHERVHSTR